MKKLTDRTARSGTLAFEQLPSALRTAARRGYVRSIVQFGSSLHAKRPSDIDLAVILREDAYGRFRRLVDPAAFKGFDLSLILDSELGRPDAFRFGSHGPHLAVALRDGAPIYGENPFRTASVSRKIVRASILLRLYDYMYAVRKAVFTSSPHADLRRRWKKFSRLCLLLLEKDLAYPGVLRMDEVEAMRRLRRLGVHIGSDLIQNYENVWEKVLRREKSLS